MYQILAIPEMCCILMFQQPEADRNPLDHDELWWNPRLGFNKEFLFFYVLQGWQILTLIYFFRFGYFLCVDDLMMLIFKQCHVILLCTYIKQFTVLFVAIIEVGLSHWTYRIYLSSQSNVIQYILINSSLKILFIKWLLILISS